MIDTQFDFAIGIPPYNGGTRQLFDNGPRFTALKVPRFFPNELFTSAGLDKGLEFDDIFPPTLPNKTASAIAAAPPSAS